jgi:hypothetical protein
MLSDRNKAELEGAPPGDRRVDERTVTIFRPVLIETDGFAGFCLVRNLSANGMMGRVYRQLRDGERAIVRFNGELQVPGKVVWSQEGQVGLNFDVAVDVPSLLAKLANKTVEGRINRAPRLQICCEGELEIEGRTQLIRLIDISQRGLKAQVSLVRQGDEAVIRLDGLDPRKAVVRWTRHGTAGLNFLRPLGFEELAEWAIGRQEREQADGPGAAGQARRTA